MFGRKKKKVNESMELAKLREQRLRVIQELGAAQATDKRYDDLLERAKTLEELIHKEEMRLNPPKDKITKADWLKTGVTAAMFGAAFIPELKGHVILKSPLRRFIEKPRLWGGPGSKM